MMLRLWKNLLVIGLLACSCSGLLAQSTQQDNQREAKANAEKEQLPKLPAKGQIPPTPNKIGEPTEGKIAFSAMQRNYRIQIQTIRHKHFGKMRVAKIRQQGIDQIKEFTDPAAYEPLIKELVKEADDVRLALLDHFSEQGDYGQGALAWLAVYEKDPAIRNESMMRLVAPATGPVLSVLDQALRSRNDHIATNAGALAGALNALETIPLLIFAQAATSAADSKGDMAWMAIETQIVFTAGIEPVVGDGAAAFRPILGVISDGFVLRIVDAVAISYRTQIHISLVAMTTHDWGQSTEYLGYDMGKWREWYNTQYIPFKNEQALLAKLAEDS
ncbi:MAG: hypothetical protein IH984_13975 [Planctomycetes bacterium]|nr:hypothetical protein [Planctomycetota bacterium]